MDLHFEDNSKQFLEWKKQVQEQVKEWTGYLVDASLQKKTYKSAINWLNKNQPDFPVSYSATTNDIFDNLIRSMFEDAKKQVRDQAMNTETEKDN